VVQVSVFSTRSGEAEGSSKAYSSLHAFPSSHNHDIPVTYIVPGIDASPKVTESDDLEPTYSSFSRLLIEKDEVLPLVRQGAREISTQDNELSFRTRKHGEVSIQLLRRCPRIHGINNPESTTANLPS
jgi:hypothetical protein